MVCANQCCLRLMVSFLLLSAILVGQERSIEQIVLGVSARGSSLDPRAAVQLNPDQTTNWIIPAVATTILFRDDFYFVVGANVTGFTLVMSPTIPSNADIGIYVRKDVLPTLAGTSVVADYRNEAVATGQKTLSVSAGPGSFLSQGIYHIGLGLFAPLNQQVSYSLRLTLTTGTTCTYALTSALTNSGRVPLGAAAGSGSISVNTAAGCAWTASSNASWVRLTSSTGSGSGVVQFAVDANLGGQREGVISIGQNSITIVQSALLTTELRPGAKILTHIAAGDVWATTIYLTNLSVSSIEGYSLDFYQEDGKKWALGMNEGTPGLGFGSSLRPGETVTYTTSKSTSLQVGWAALYGGPNIAGVAVFRSNSASGNVQEAAAPIISQPLKKYVMLFVANTEGDTGLAVVNPSAQILNVQVEFRNAAGQILAPYVFNLPPLGHMGFSLLTTVPRVYGQEGIMTFTGDVPFAILGLKFNRRTGSFTSFEPLYPFGTAR